MKLSGSAGAAGREGSTPPSGPRAASACRRLTDHAIFVFA